MATCVRPGCGGAIEDGYCAVCGLAARATVPDGSRAAAPVPVTAGPATCKRAGCGGTIEEGYCAACGMAASPSERPGAASSRTGSGKTPSTRSTRSARSTRTGSTRSGRSASRALGGLPVTRPPLPPQDPLGVLVPGVVPDKKRFCSGCDAKLGREAGFCPKCGQEYSFVPSLSPGDVVQAKYEIKGTIAFGGLGWIYLALDTVLSRWVILKGLLNAKDPRMIEVAVKEREYLAAVKHPNIVGIYDFITHGNQGFIVMEFVNGKTLMKLRKERGGPLPVAEAITYVLEILPAFRYLDEQGLVYCDFKPENVMVEESTVKLIDLGAVRHVDDTGGDIYGSKGYTAPEAHERPTPVSDLFSVARALAVLVADFDFQGRYEQSLPPAQEVPAFASNEALYRFLVKATRPNEADRFQTAEEMSEQLLGVLRLVAGGGEVGHVESTVFEHDADGPSEVPSAKLTTLPRPKAAREEAAAGIILAAGAVADPDRRLKMFERALAQHVGSLDLKLRIVDELVTLGRYPEAEARLATLQSEGGGTDWRLAWYRGRCLLAQGKIQETLAAFHSILDELPGELAPKHALARAYEEQGELDRAISYYQAVCDADASFTSAAFGLARCMERRRNRAGAAAAYRRVPATSSRYVAAQMALARVLVDDALGAVEAGDLALASEAIETLVGLSDGLELHKLRADVLRAGAVFVETGGVAADGRIAGLPATSRALRSAAEGELRACARAAQAPGDRVRFVDMANAVRPRTWV